MELSQGIPTLYSQRLMLRPFAHSDAKTVQQLAGDKRIADTTASIPHPYPDGLAEQWIATHQPQWQNRQSLIFAITLMDQTPIIGSIALINMDLNSAQAEIGYWIAVDQWGHGYCTEACTTLVEFGFDSLKLSRIYAQYLTRNRASAVVLAKLGFQPLATRMDRCGKHSQVEAIAMVEILSR